LNQLRRRSLQCRNYWHFFLTQANAEDFEKKGIADLHDPSMNLRWLSDVIEESFPGQALLIRAVAKSIAKNNSAMQ
jgi:hypothetical protein